MTRATEPIPEEPVDCDLVAFAAHPDDAELNCGGTLALSERQGWRTAIVDFTRGELSTRGTTELRTEEAREAAKVLGLSCRVNLGLPDGRLRDDDESRERVVELIRRMRPRLVIAPPLRDHHADHMAVAEIVSRAFYLAGVAKYGPALSPWRPNGLLHYASSQPGRPDTVVDISSVYDVRRDAVMCYRSQFHDPGSKEGATRIALPEFMDWVDGRLRHWGFLIGASRGEAFTSPEPVPVTNPVASLGRGRWENPQDDD